VRSRWTAVFAAVDGGSLLRQTVIAHGRYAIRERRTEAARRRHHGLHILTFEQLAARLAGVSHASVDEETLRQAVPGGTSHVEPRRARQSKIATGNGRRGGGTRSVRYGAPALICSSEPRATPRLASIATLETAVLAMLPPAMMRPADLVAAALARLEHAPVLIGPVEIVGLTELALCWRPLLLGLGDAGPGALDRRARDQCPPGLRVAAYRSSEPKRKCHRSLRSVPPLLTRRRSTPCAGPVHVLASAKPHRQRLRLQPSTPVDYDDYFLALRRDANVELHFRARPCTSPPAGKGKRLPRLLTSCCVVSRKYACGGSRLCCVPIRVRFRIFPRAGHVSCRATRRSRRVRHGPACWSG